MLSKTLQEDFGFEATRADPDVYRRAATHDDGFEHYEHIFVYVDDLLILLKQPMNWMKKLSAIYDLKEDSVGPPDTHLGAQIGKTQLPDGFTTWHMEAEKYVKNAIEVVQKLLDEDGNGPQIKQAKTPFPISHKPELDVTEELDDAMISRFRQLIGILRWAVELGRVDVCLEVSVLSQYLASPRQGHLETAYHLFACLKAHPQVKLVFDPTEPFVDESRFQKVDWTEAYGDVVEELPARCLLLSLVLLMQIMQGIV